MQITKSKLIHIIQKELQQLISEGPDPMWNRDDDEDALFNAEDTEDQPGSSNRLVYGEHGDEA